MICNNEGVKVSAKIKAKLVLKEYLDRFNLEKDCSDFSIMKKTEPDKVKDQISKIVERMAKALVIKEGASSNE